MLDINSRIKWMPGMELTAQTFRSLSEDLDFRQQLALQAALGNHRMGLLPGAEFINTGCFVKNRFEMERFRCLAVLPSGRLVDADESVAIDIPMLYGTEYYLTVSIGLNVVEFEKEGIPYVRPQYEYAINTLEEVEQADVLPVVRFRADNGVFSVETDFIPPCLMLSADARFQTYIGRYAEQLQALIAHANLEEGEGKRALLRYLFRLKSYGQNNAVHDFVLLLQEMVQAIDYYIVTPQVEEPKPVPEPSPADVERWLRWVEDYLTGASSVLDHVVLEDNTIDYFALLEQAKKELYERLNPELYEKLLLKIKGELREELQTHLTAALQSYVDDNAKPELGSLLSTELHEKLHGQLYPELYEALFNALYVPTPEEEEFIPII